jgi:hypothetical protein
MLTAALLACAMRQLRLSPAGAGYTKSVKVPPGTSAHAVRQSASLANLLAQTAIITLQ